VLEQSEDLSTWTPVQTNMLLDSAMELHLPIGTNREFFRMKVQNGN
jgi:hypothetical protein